MYHDSLRFCILENLAQQLLRVEAIAEHAVWPNRVGDYALRVDLAEQFSRVSVVDGDAVLFVVGFHFPPNSSFSSCKVLMVASRLRSRCMLEIFFLPFFPVRQDSDGR